MELTQEQTQDRKWRLEQSSQALGQKIKDMIIELEDTYKIRFTFGLEYTPFGIKPAFLPTDIKEYIPEVIEGE